MNRYHQYQYISISISISNRHNSEVPTNYPYNYSVARLHVFSRTGLRTYVPTRMGPSNKAVAMATAWCSWYCCCCRRYCCCYFRRSYFVYSHACAFFSPLLCFFLSIRFLFFVSHNPNMHELSYDIIMNT